MYQIWEIFSQLIVPFTLGFGLGAAATALFVIPSIVGSIVGKEKWHEQLTESERRSLSELVAILTLHGPEGVRPSRKSIGEILKRDQVKTVIGIGEGISESVQSLVRAYDDSDHAAYAKAVEDCRLQCRYVGAVDGVSDNAVAAAIMKMIVKPATALESAGRSLTDKFWRKIRRWRTKPAKKAEKEAEIMMSARPARAIKLPLPAAPPRPATRAAPSRTAGTQTATARASSDPKSP